MNQDRIEENNAAAALISHLSGKPIITTSGDENHVIKPVSVDFKVGITKQGEELAVSITQSDRHHPHLVYDTIKNGLNELEEFRPHKIKELKPDCDYNQQTGTMTFRYEIPSGAADSIIHSLSEKGQQIKSSQQSDSIGKVIEYFSAGRNVGVQF